ncbi:hypothetical protein EON65_57490 [archaeon]|nr:MAG: hypothetical protein EON65_57490 [archaeon]
MNELLQRVDEGNCFLVEGVEACMLTPSPSKQPPPMPTIPEVDVLRDHSTVSATTHRDHYNSSVSMLVTNSWQDLKQTLDGMQMSHKHLMAILNRCLDYRKLVNNLPLVPRYAPVSIRQVLQQAALGQ